MTLVLQTFMHIIKNYINILLLKLWYIEEGKMDCLQQHKNKLLENGRRWIMNCNRPNLSRSCEQLFLFCKMPFVKWTCTWKWRTIARAKRVGMNKNKQKWRTKSKGEWVKHEWNNRNINGGEKKTKLKGKNLM
jgi:hypothetical protein